MLDDIQSEKDDVEYMLVFKLSRFGRNAADVLYSLQLMQDFGVNLKSLYVIDNYIGVKTLEAAYIVQNSVIFVNSILTVK